MEIKERKELRREVAYLLGASGCSCCRDDANWYGAIQRLAKILRVPKYKDGSGYDFAKFRNEK